MTRSQLEKDTEKDRPKHNQSIKLAHFYFVLLFGEQKGVKNRLVWNSAEAQCVKKNGRFSQKAEDQAIEVPLTTTARACRRERR